MSITVWCLGKTWNVHVSAGGQWIRLTGIGNERDARMLGEDWERHFLSPASPALEASDEEAGR